MSGVDDSQASVGPLNRSNFSTTSTGRGAQAAPSSSATMTMTAAPPQNPEPEVLRLTLRNAPSVRWDESVVDNEGLGRKSSKRCCIFHKQRRFDESSTDSSDEEDGDGNDRKPIARPKKKVPDYQRFHA